MLRLSEDYPQITQKRKRPAARSEGVTTETSEVAQRRAGEGARAVPEEEARDPIGSIHEDTRPRTKKMPRWEHRGISVERGLVWLKVMDGRRGRHRGCCPSYRCLNDCAGCHSNTAGSPGRSPD